MEPCQICGVVGVKDLLQTCSICHDIREHAYCMEVKPSKVPRIWHCKACQLQIDEVKQQSKEKMGIVDTSYSVKVQYSGTDKDLFEMPGHKAVASPKNNLRSHTSKGPQTGKVKFLPTEAVRRMETGGKPKASSMHGGPSLRFSSVGASHGPLSWRNPDVSTIAPSWFAHWKGLTQGSSRHSKPPTVATLPAGTHRSFSRSQSFPSQKSSLASESLGKRKMEDDRTDCRRISLVTNKKTSTGSSENLGKRKMEENKPEDRRRILDVNRKEASTGSLESLGKRKMEEDKPEVRMRILDVSNKEKNIGAPQNLGKRKVEEDRPEDRMRISYVTGKKKSTDVFEGLGKRKMEQDRPEVRMRILDVSNKEKNIGAPQNQGKRKMEEDRSDDRMRISYVTGKKKSTDVSEGLGKRKMEQDRPEDSIRISVVSNKEKSIGASESRKRKMAEDGPGYHMRILDVTNKEKSTGASEGLGKRKMAEDILEDSMRILDVIDKEKSTGTSESQGKRKEEDRPEDCMRILDVTNNEKSIGASESLGKRKVEEDRPEDCMKVLDVTNKEKSTSALESLGKRKMEEDRPDDCMEIANVTNEEKSTASVIPSRFLGKNGLVDGFLSCNPIGTSDFIPLSQFGEEILNPPVTQATWEGSFEVVEYYDRFRVEDIYDGFRAHSPGKVSRKAYEVSQKLPTIVKFTIHRRCDLWPDIFNKDGPSGNDIALYFFPGDFASSINYTCLLELMEKRDLMMQSCMDGVELLIFTSKQLPVNSQRLNSQLYLWGVFRSRKGPSLTFKFNKREIPLPLCKTRTDHDPTDISNRQQHELVKVMEIDMIGGMDIGRVDISMRRQNSEGSELQLKTEKVKFRFSNSLIHWRKSRESHVREGDKDNTRTSSHSCSHQIVASSSSLKFKIHGQKHTD